jgi:hypothetical protein
MISNARGKHSSPGVYIEEIDKSYASKSLGVTTLGVVGETLKGPAFEPVRISDWTEFQNYFGGTSTEKFKGTGYPKYELPYIAKSYLQQSKQLEVCRVLGFSGYDAGNAWVIYGYKNTASTAAVIDETGEGTSSTTGGNSGAQTTTSHDSRDKYVIAILRSKAEYSGMDKDAVCNGEASNDEIKFDVTKVEMKAYSTVESTLAGCTISGSSTNGNLTVSKGKYGKFTLEITVGNTVEKVPVSLNPGESEYIVNMLGMDPHSGNYSLFVEEVYDLAHMAVCDDGATLYNTLDVASCDKIKNYKEQFRSAMTPWFVSEIKGSGTNVDLKKLFRFHTISDGNAANSQVKISIANIMPDEGLFDVIIRDYHDTDNTPVVLERFNKCCMMPGQSNYIGLQIGTYNGDYALKSKYVTVEVIENDMTQSCVPCGFLGYPLRNMGDKWKAPTLAYNTDVYDMLKANRQYFGMSDLVGVDLDVLSYKGKDAYHSDQLPSNGYSNGFHLDAFLNATTTDATTKKTSSLVTFTVDGLSGYEFTTPSSKAGVELGATEMPHITSEDLMENNIYADKRYRKFTCYPYGGFDGWDIYRESRTNTNDYRANKYKGATNAMIPNPDCVTKVEAKFQKDNNLTNLKNLTDDQTKALNKLIDDCDKILNTEHAFSSVFDSGAYGLSGKVINSDYYAYLAGYKQFDNPHKVKINLLATPGIDYVHNLDLFNEVLDIVEEYRQGDCLYIVTTPDTEDGEEIDAESAVSNLETQEISTSYAATYYPWVKYYDATNKKYINLPATKDVVRNFAYTDNVSQPWFASAGMSRGPVDCVKATHFTRQDEEDILYEGMINPVKTFAVDGVKIWGNKTMYQEDTPLNRINVRRLMIRVKDLVMSAATKLIFEQNDSTVDAQFRSIVEPILSNVKQNRGISDFKVVTDTSAEARDRKELPAAIHVKPINCLEYIPITFTIYPEGAKFDE